MSGEKCKARVWCSTYGGYRPCRNAAKRDGYCNAHDPEAIAERAEARRRRFDERVALQRARTRRMCVAADLVVWALDNPDALPPELRARVEALRGAS